MNLFIGAEITFYQSQCVTKHGGHKQFILCASVLFSFFFWLLKYKQPIVPTRIDDFLFFSIFGFYHWHFVLFIKTKTKRFHIFFFSLVKKYDFYCPYSYIKFILQLQQSLYFITGIGFKATKIAFSSARSKAIAFHLRLFF